MIACLFALAPHFNLPLKPQVIKTAGGQRLLNPLQLNNLAQILPGITFCILCFCCLIVLTKNHEVYGLTLSKLCEMLEEVEKISQ